MKVYKCEAMAGNCGSCLTINATYGCGWCGSSCQIMDQCDSPDMWLDNTAICPNPSVLSVCITAIRNDNNNNKVIEILIKIVLRFVGVGGGL